ncbi:TetR/AcrR family transcriptional regulator [Kribbia dieselivorans]|uniref:TetR/AcrR family transcriptional regulator n=1 Tax=Kribbia dieselivorans TaxID=331526 RepID=UPI000838F257|nr:TetR/AcrR family transcriptional regulator [Kribbia dieselivorans]
MTDQVAAREPQQDRSRATRERLLAATITCLATKGWAATTMQVVAAQAGISRGAAQHHFPTRELLIEAALRSLFDQRMEALRQVDPPQGSDRVRYVVQLVVDVNTDTFFKAAVQAWTAAAADPALLEHIGPLERRFARGVHAVAVELLEVDDSDPRVRSLIQGTLDMARGLGLADLLSDDSKRRARIIAAWSEQLRDALAKPAG